MTEHLRATTASCRLAARLALQCVQCWVALSIYGIINILRTSYVCGALRPHGLESFSPQGGQLDGVRGPEMGLITSLQI